MTAIAIETSNAAEGGCYGCQSTSHVMHGKFCENHGIAANQTGISITCRSRWLRAPATKQPPENICVFRGVSFIPDSPVCRPGKLLANTWSRSPAQSGVHAAVGIQVQCPHRGRSVRRRRRQQRGHDLWQCACTTACGTACTARHSFAAVAPHRRRRRPRSCSDGLMAGRVAGQFEISRLR